MVVSEKNQRIKKEETPMMKQYQGIKNDHPDSILFFRMGDFYEMFNEDAKIASKILQITLTSRNKNLEVRVICRILEAIFASSLNIS